MSMKHRFVSLLAISSLYVLTIRTAISVPIMRCGVPNPPYETKKRQFRRWHRDMPAADCLSALTPLHVIILIRGFRRKETEAKIPSNYSILPVLSPVRRCAQVPLSDSSDTAANEESDEIDYGETQ